MCAHCRAHRRGRHSVSSEKWISCAAVTRSALVILAAAFTPGKRNVRPLALPYDSTALVGDLQDGTAILTGYELNISLWICVTCPGDYPSLVNALNLLNISLKRSLSSEDHGKVAHVRICVLINEGNATARDMYAYSFQAVPVYFIMVYALALASHVRKEAIKQLVISCHCVLLSFPRRLGFCRKGLDRSERLRYNVFAPFKPSGFYGAPPASCLAWSLTMSRRGLFFYSVRFSASSALSKSFDVGM